MEKRLPSGDPDVYSLCNEPMCIPYNCWSGTLLDMGP